MPCPSAFRAEHLVEETAIAEDVRRFILECFPSVPHLEALLLLRRAGGDWDAARLARRLYIAERMADVVLRELVDCGLLAVDASTAAYRYQPADPHRAGMVDRVAETYARALVAVTNLIHGRSGHLFADAFKLRKD